MPAVQLCAGTYVISLEQICGLYAVKLMRAWCCWVLIALAHLRVVSTMAYLDVFPKHTRLQYCACGALVRVLMDVWPAPSTAVENCDCTKHATHFI